MWASGGADGVRQVCGMASAGRDGGQRTCRVASGREAAVRQGCGGAFCGKEAVRQSWAMGSGDADSAALSCERWNFCKAVVGIHQARGVWFVGGNVSDGLEVGNRKMEASLDFMGRSFNLKTAVELL